MRAEHVDKDITVYGAPPQLYADLNDLSYVNMKTASLEIYSSGLR